MEYSIKQGVLFEYGATALSEGVNFCFAASGLRTLFLCIYDADGKLLIRVDMVSYHAFGNVYSVLIGPYLPDDISYTIEKDGRIYIDPYIKNVKKLRKWGETRRKGHVDSAALYKRDYDWEQDKPLKLDFNDIIAYELHVRGYTRHPSSGVAHKGTFLGLIEKLPYLSELGVTQVILLPAYFFYEFDQLLPKYTDVVNSSVEKDGYIERMNYWGFKEACYFMPKPEYSWSDDFIIEFKDMVKAFHKAGIEIVMRFYFPESVNRNLIVPCLEHWVSEYHIDGFFLMGLWLPMDLIVTNDVLCDTKIYYDNFDIRGCGFSNNSGRNKNLALADKEYMNIARRYLKSDEDMISPFIAAQSKNPAGIKQLNFVTAYEGFTLNDLVSYDYKHNEENNEDNRDGEDYNYSWNCGVEGISRKKNILKLRLKQVKNIMTMLFMARGIPVIYGGDEFLNSQKGNNNPYCQDNGISWINWKDTKDSTEFFKFTKELIAFRKAHPIVHMCHEPKLMDHLSCGYPDLSYHSEQAWYPKLHNHIRHVGMMYCGFYAKRADGTDDDFIYIAYNMHWEEHGFALPKLPEGASWQIVLCSEEDVSMTGDCLGKEDSVKVPQRSVMVLKSVFENNGNPKKKERRNQAQKKAGMTG